jgi:hypothetical protein
MTDDPRAEQLYRLGGACLSVTGLERSSIATVQALLLQGHFALNSKGENECGESDWQMTMEPKSVGQS